MKTETVRDSLGHEYSVYVIRRANGDQINIDVMIANLDPQGPEHFVEMERQAAEAREGEINAPA